MKLPFTRQRRRRHSATATGKNGADSRDTEEVLEEAAPLEPPQPFLWLYLLVPMAGLALCGSREAWALGMLAILIGLCGLVAPPRRRVSPVFTVPVVLAVVLCLSAFLPASWFPEPSWRTSLVQNYGIVLAGTRSPQPWVTLESWLLLAVGACWLVFCLGRGFIPQERKRALQCLAVFIALVALAALFVRWRQIEVPLWRATWNFFYFGPFPNRNNFSGLLAVGAVLAFACGHDALRRRQARWLVFILCMVLAFACILLNTSRLGVITFFAGLGGWMLTSGINRGSLQRVALSAAVMLVFAAGFFIFGQGLIKRFNDQGGFLSTLSQESRLETFADAVRVISTAPWGGVGLGCFEPVFALVRTKGELYSRALHPENDWLWFGAEAGLICLALALFLFGALVKHFAPWFKRDAAGRRDRRLRLAAGTSVVLVGLAGLADTPVHAPGFAVLLALLAGLALHPQAQSGLQANWAPWLHRGMGLFCIVCGVLWLAAAAGRPLFPGNTVFKQLSDRAVQLAARGDAAGALEMWNKAVTIKPLQWSLYYDRAVLSLKLGKPPMEAAEDFARTRKLEPHSAVLCCREFDLWLKHHPAYGMPALREALRRDPSRAVEFYRDRVGKVAAHPELRNGFRSLADGDPKLELLYLSVATQEEFPQRLASILVRHPSLEVYTAKERESLFENWYRTGDREALFSHLRDNAAWRKDGWRVLAQHEAQHGDFRAAYQTALNNLDAPYVSGSSRQGSLSDLHRAFLYNPTDLSRGIEFFDALKQAGKLEEALATLDQLAGLPNAPARLLYERALIFAKKEDYSRAWQSISEYSLRAAHGQPQ